MNQAPQPNPTSSKMRSLHALLPIILDVVIPVGVYYILHKIGFSDFVALTVGGVLTAISVLFRIITAKKVDQFGVFMMAMFALGIILLFVTGDPRLILAKPALFVAVAAGFLLLSLRKRPAMLSFAKPMATEGSAQLEELWERAWRTSKPFQRVIKVSTIMFALALLIDAVGRVFIVYHMPIARAVSVSQLPGLIALILAIIYHLKTVKPVFEDIKKHDL